MAKSKQVSKAVVVAALRKQAKPHMSRLSAISKIATREEYEAAAKTLKALKEIGRLAEAKYKAIYDPINAGLKELKALFKPFADERAQIESAVKIAMEKFLADVDRKQLALEAKFDAGKISTPEELVRKTQELDVSSDFASVRTLRIAVAVDESKTPREYMIPDVGKITDALKEGKKVSGWTLESKKSIAI